MVAVKTPLRCLVADDEPQICALLRDALAMQGYEADVVSDGDAASRKLAEREYALFVSDLMMPFKTGVELVREIRARDQETPVVLMSSFLSDEALAACSRLEHFAFLQKPFSLTDLRHAVERAKSTIRC